MLARHALRTIRRLTISSYRRVRTWVSAPGRLSRNRHEFSRVNACVGIEPVRPALSGLEVRKPAGMPRRAARLLIHLAYRWQPSQEYRRRQLEMRELNKSLKRRPRLSPHLPPILLYVEDDDLLPKRLQPLLNSAQQNGQLLPELPRDLRDLEAAARAPSTWFLRPRLPETDPEYLLSSRPLLPRQYREFLKSSPYPRLVISVTAIVAATVGITWVSQVQQAEARARVRFHVARTAFQSELDAARDYGVDPRLLQPVKRRARSLEELSAPVSFAISRARVQFYAEQASSYRALLRTLRHLERRALEYWTWKEGNTYASLVEATQEVHGLGLQASLPSIPGCDTPACYRSAVTSQAGRAAWLRQTAATLRGYGASIRAAPDPASAADTEVQMARSLSAILPAWAPTPARITELDGMYATAAGLDGYTRVGALGRLDVDALRAALMRILPSRAIVISTEEQSLTCYERAKVVCSSPVTAGSATPTGIFHIQVKQASISTLYWNRTGDSFQYRPGFLPDWMALSQSAADPGSSGMALQGAPWRAVFGLGSDVWDPAYAPSTPGSIDLPPGTAAFIFRWAPIGTEVVVY